jgi:non-structural maintenance of chromosomes element 1
MVCSVVDFPRNSLVLLTFSPQSEGRPILPEDVTQADFSSYIASANTAISPFDLEIRGIVHQVPKENSNGNSGRVYALVNTTSDPLTQLATTYTADEISFVKRVLDAIFETFNTSRCEAMVITGVQAMQLAKAGSGDASRRESNGTASQSQGATAQSLSMTQAELVMKRLVEEGWFEMSEKGFYSLSPRGLIELRGWLVETYNDDEENDYRANRIKFCAACKDVITVVSSIFDSLSKREKGC